MQKVIKVKKCTYFSIPSIPQAGLFPPMTLEAFQAFTTYWYAQAQAQTQTRKGQFLVPPMAPFFPPPVQLVVKFSKLANEARQLGCETFSGTVNAIAAKN